MLTWGLIELFKRFPLNQCWIHAVCLPLPEEGKGTLTGLGGGGSLEGCRREYTRRGLLSLALVGCQNNSEAICRQEQNTQFNPNNPCTALSSLRVTTTSQVHFGPLEVISHQSSPLLVCLHKSGVCNDDTRTLTPYLANNFSETQL